MTKSQISLLGSLLAAGALAFAGCGGGSSGGGTGGKVDGGTGGKGSGGMTVGTGGKVDGGGTGGTGVGGATDAGTDRTDTGTPETGTGDTGPCITSFASGSRLLFAFNNGANIGWTAGVESDPSNWGLASSLSIGGTASDGDTCPGAVTLTIPFGPSGTPDAGGQAQIAMKYTGYYGNTLDWTGYSKLHMSIKVISSSYTALSNIQAYAGLITTTSPTGYPYLSSDTGAIANATPRRMVIDMSGQPPATTRVNEIGVRIQLNASAVAPPTVEVLIDDIWLEAAPPPDAGPDVGPDVAPDLAPDVPSVDVPTDITVDTGTDVTAG